MRHGHPMRTAALLLLAGALAPADAGAQRAQADPVAGGVVYRIPVSGVIELGVAPYIERSLREAEAAGAVAAIIELETPGGRVDAAQRIVNALTDAPLPVYAYVNHRAYSAGALIAMAAERIYMRPNSVIGAATPVTGEGQKAPEKIVSAMRSEMRALAEARGLDPRVAEAMVDEEIEIAGVVERGKLLTLTTAEAVELGYAREVEDYDALLAELGAPGATTVQTEVSWAENLVRLITHPVVTPLLLSLGFLGLLIEIKTPGLGLAGGAGIVSLGLFFGGHYLAGLTGWGELLVLGLGGVLLALEIFLVPGFGLFGIAGILGILAGIYMSLVGQFSTVVDYSRAAGTLSATLILVLVAGWALVRTLPRNTRLQRSGILLGERADRATGYLSADERPDLVGRSGVALTDLRPAGTGRFDTERLDVVAENGWIPAGTGIRVVRSDGYRNVVLPE